MVTNIKCVLAFDCQAVVRISSCDWRVTVIMKFMDPGCPEMKLWSQPALCC